MTVEETISYLGLDSLDPKTSSDKKSTYDIDQKLYAKIFTLLDKNESDWVEDSSQVDNSDEDSLKSEYYLKKGDEDIGKIELVADLEKDKYSITIEEIISDEEE